MDYKEQLLKTEAYREMLKQSLARNNGYYKNKDITEMLKKIDLRYSILSHSQITENSLFDVESWNQESFALYTDICILYKTIIEYEKQKLVELQAKIESYTSSIQSLADRCTEINKMHSASTSIGDIVLFKNNSFDEDINNETAVVNLGKTTIPANKNQMLFFIGGYGFDPYASYCRIYAGNKEIARISAYNTSGNVFNIKDSYKQLKIESKDIKYEYTLDSDSIINNIFVVPDIDTNDNIKNAKYYLGKNKIIIKDIYKYETEIFDMINGKSYDVAANKKIRFCIKDGLYFNIDFSVLPQKRNFTETKISKITEVKIIEFTTDVHTQFKIDTDCDIYADIEDLKQNNDDYYISSIPNGIEDCLVVGESITEDITIDNIDVVIPVSDINSFKIQSITLRAKWLDYDSIQHEIQRAVWIW